MKRIALCVGFILFFSSVRIALCETRTDIEGSLKSISVAEKSGDWAFATIDQRKVAHVYFYESSGDELWHLSNLEDSELSDVYHVQVRVSEKAETILVIWQGIVNWVQLYNRDRSLLFDRQWNREFYLNWMAADGSLLFYDKIYLPSGKVEAVIYPDEIQIPPNPKQRLLDNSLIVMAATVKRDTILSSAQTGQKGYRSPGQRTRRPPRGILALKDERVFYLIDRDGSIRHREGLGVGGGVDFTPLGDNLFLVESRVNGTKRLQLMRNNGVPVWQSEHPTGHMGDNYWYGDEEYVLLASTYSSEFIVINCKSGREIDRKKYLQEQRIGSVISMFREADRIVINRYAVPVQDRPQIGTRILRLSDGGRLGNHSDSPGLKLKLPGEKSYLIYTSPDEKYHQRIGVSSSRFRLSITGK